ncbi:MAG: potassium-transporting ATPase subunit KdpC [Bdellovibrionaceae bacterium]|nr:potassium-transporting ATPase subunit KdpC [Pseudobdellovibrionaceae bacterium]
MKNLKIGLKIFFVMTFITGIVYPLLIWSYSLVFVKEKSVGSYVSHQDKIVGSELIGQKFTQAKYFYGRPSAPDYNATASSGSNLGPTSSDLKKQVSERIQDGIPPDLIFASGSGLDPHISLEAALFQTKKVAEARGLDVSTVRNLINELTEAPQYGILGETRINVLQLNLALDRLKK